MVTELQEVYSDCPVCEVFESNYHK
uniref:Uncharacterized protein n=1 Tax=Moniliophthora roreri TaxID=221103 RepID=A0A0W0FTY2_MONRR